MNKIIADSLFFRATACNATHGLAIGIMYVSSTVCQILALWQNGKIVCQYIKSI